MGSPARFVAICLVAVYFAETALRLALLVPVYHYSRGSIPFHGAAVVLSTLAAGWALARSSGRPWAQLLLATVLATFWTMLLVFDVAAFVTAPRFHKAMPLHMIGEFYCAGKLTGCVAAQPGIAALIGGIAATLALLIWIAADTLADLAGRAANRATALLGGRKFPLRLLVALLAVAYAAPWILIPKMAGAREPLVGFLAPGEFIAGPQELLTRPRPRYRVAPTPGARPRTLVLITVDSLRADAVELRPGRPTLTPFLRSLASTGMLHDLGPATAVCPNSYCGLVALQSGSDWAALQNGPPLTLADVLAANGYRSHFLLGGPHRKAMNLGELYGPNLTTFLDDADPDSTGLGDDREQLRRLPGVPIHDPSRSYLSIHLMSAHRAGFRFSSATDKATLRQALFGAGNPKDNAEMYRRGVRQADWIIGRIFAVLERRGLLADAVVIITADHGERYRPGQRPGHGVPLDMDVAEIPLLVYDTGGTPWPRQAGASHMDVAPTLLAAAGIEQPASWRGGPLQRPVQRLGAPMDTLHASALVGSVAGVRLMLRCDTSTGRTDVVARHGLPVSASLRAAALAAAPTLHRGLADRTDAGRCFR